MNPPVLNRKLVLEDAYRSPDGLGGYVNDWQALGLMWGHVSYGTGGARAEQTQPLSRVPVRIVVRASPFGAPSRPRAGQRFREGGRIFAINAVTEDDDHSRYLLCECVEEVAI